MNYWLIYLYTYVADRDPEEIVDGEKVQDIIVYVNRLGVAKKRVDKRISALSGEQFDFVREVFLKPWKYY